MPPDPPDRDPHTTADRARDHSTLADDPVAEDRAEPRPEATHRRDSLWIRVGPDQAGQPDDREPPGAAAGPSIASIESELEHIDLVVEATGTDATGQPRDVQDVVDQYERILAQRAAADPEPDSAADDERGLLDAAVAWLRSIAEDARR